MGSTASMKVKEYFQGYELLGGPSHLLQDGQGSGDLQPGPGLTQKAELPRPAHRQMGDHATEHGPFPRKTLLLSFLFPRSPGPATRELGTV